MFETGVWHKLCGLEPQYNHMIGTPFYEKYMEGYNSIKNSVM